MIKSKLKHLKLYEDYSKTDTESELSENPIVDLDNEEKDESKDSEFNEEE